LSSFSSAFPDYAIYLLHYRGYRALRKPSEDASLSAQALFDRVTESIPILPS
jgi:hypothetical protein